MIRTARCLMPATLLMLSPAGPFSLLGYGALPASAAEAAPGAAADDGRAVEFLEMAAEAGSTRAKRLLGEELISGERLPVDPERGIALSGIGMSYLMLERHEEALAWGENALREMPGYGSSHRVVIGALVGLGRLDEARAAASRLMEAFPTYTLTLQRRINPWRDEAFAERYVEALRVAGIPE